MSETLLDQAKRIHAAHVIAGALDGHTAPDEWRNCEHPDCSAFRASVVPTYRVAPARALLIQLAGHNRAANAAAAAARDDGQDVAVDGAPEQPGPAEQEAANRAYAASRAAGQAPGEAILAAWRAALEAGRAEP